MGRAAGRWRAWLRRKSANEVPRAQARGTWAARVGAFSRRRLRRKQEFEREPETAPAQRLLGVCYVRRFCMWCGAVDPFNNMYLICRVCGTEEMEQAAVSFLWDMLTKVIVRK